jgi:hypothetical protein
MASERNPQPRPLVQRAKTIILEGVRLQLRQCIKCDIEFYGTSGQVKCGECRKDRKKRA